MVIAIAGFNDLEEIHHSNTSLILRGRRASDELRVVLKTAGDSRPNAAHIALLRREARLTARARGARVAKILDVVEREGVPVLVLEDVGGASLDRVDSALSLVERLRLAVDIARAVEDVHASGLIHKDINPSNLVWNRGTDVLKLVDFGLATDLAHEAPTPVQGGGLAGTLAYLAPEQTGRMRASVDRRSDLYALGATLYELFSGQRPFDVKDPLELVHAHIARVPAALRTRDASIPATVSELVMRLLEKDPRRRYQSAHGVRSDLERCASELEADGAVSPFRLGANDRGDVLELPHTLYGRTDERRRLLDAAERAAAGGCAFVLVSGAAGIGKTALVRELYAPLARQRVELLDGKFDQFRLGGPYAPLGRAFGRFLRWVLTQDEATVLHWRARIGGALGRGAGALVDVLPELTTLLGPQPPAEALSSAAAENRLHLAFRELVGAIASPKRPVALFLDDLQWADVPTLRLLERIVTDVERRHLLVIGAYRDSEVDAAHPLHIAVDAIRRAGVVPERIELGPLSTQQVAALVRDALAQDGPEVDALAEVCRARTGGNPFFFRRFLESLGERGLVAWGPDARRWTWDLPTLAALGHTENVVSFLLDRVASLPSDARHALQHAACVGDEFELGLLASFTGRAPDALREDLSSAVEAELVAPLAHALTTEASADTAQRYRFVHDRVRQAAYASMGPDDAARAHLALGRLIERAHRGDDDGAWRFEAAQHLNAGARLMTDPAERASLARTNLEVGHRAMDAAAFARAGEHLEAGIALLPDGAWDTEYPLALALHVGAAKCAYLAGEHDRVSARIAAVTARAKAPLDQIQALEIEVEARMARDDFKGALDVSLEALAQLGVLMPREPSEGDIGDAVRRTMGVLAATSVESIEALPNATDPEVLAARRILVRASSSAYYAAPPLLPIITCELVVSSVRSGLSTATPFGLAVYGIVLNSIGMLAQAHAYGALAERLLGRWSDRSLEARTRLVVNNHVCTWTAPLEDRLDALREAYRVGRETGDFEYAAICGQCFATNAFSAGRELGGVIEDAERFGAFMRNYGQRSILRLHQPLVQLARALSGGLADPSRLDGPDFDEAEACAYAEASGSASLVFVTLSDVLIARYHFGAARDAHEVAERARPFQGGAAATYHLSNFHTYAPLAAARCFELADEAERPALLARIDESVTQLRAWADAGPMNHLHRLLLVQAERARVTGAVDEAAALYRRAMEAVRDTGYVNDEALVCELAARLHLARGGVDASIGRAFLEDAAFAYQRWGAGQKVQRLREEFPQLLNASRRAGSARSSVTASTDIDVDAAAVVRAARTISAEIELDPLLKTLFRTIIEAGGARRALLLLERGGRWELAVEGEASGEPTLTARALDDLDPREHPLSVLRYVLRTGEAVILEDASAPGSLMDGDAYARSRGARSVLCVPARHRGAMASVLYLENDRAAGVFTLERVELLRLLMSQATVSIDNAQLFEAQRRLTRAQSRFVPHQFLESLDRHDIAEVALGDAVAKTMTVLFSDLRDFTTLAEFDDAGSVIRLLNDHFGAMEPCIVEAGGFIDSFNGDEIMALFDVAPAQAVRAGVAMHAALARLNVGARRPLRMGVGLNTGPVVLGTVGGRDRIKCGVVGDAVNLASRVEGLTKRYGVRMLIGEVTRAALPVGAFSLRAVDRVTVKGRTRAQTIFEVLDALPDEARAAREGARATLELAARRFYARDFRSAAEGFGDCAAAAPDDLVPRLFLERCRRYEAEPPPDEWEGVERLG